MSNSDLENKSSISDLDITITLRSSQVSSGELTKLSDALVATLKQEVPECTLIEFKDTIFRNHKDRKSVV